MREKSQARWPWGRVALLLLVVAVAAALAYLGMRGFAMPWMVAPVPAAETGAAVTARPLGGDPAVMPLSAPCAGQMAFRAGDYATAYAALQQQYGRDLSAAYFLGLMYRDGLGIARNDALAARALGSAANAGHPGAMVALAQMFDGGALSSYPDALQWYEQAALSGDAAAREKVVSMLMEGRGAVADPVRALAWLRETEDGYAARGESLPDALQMQRQVLEAQADNNKNAVAAAIAELQGRIAVARASYPGESPCER